MKPNTAAFRFAVMALALGSGLAAGQSGSLGATDDEAQFQAWRAQCQTQRRTDCDDYEVFKSETYPPGHRCLKQSGRCQSTVKPTGGTGTGTTAPAATPRYETGRTAPSSAPPPAVIPQGEPARKPGGRQ
ncbi:MAG: hypothetical protein JNK22_10875 [Rhodocyclaceae bacterium]|nr:hypothetical protein [Rhodocyclaceae bacterium]